MSAIVTILRPETEENIQMYIEPEEKVEDIIDRCMGYWQIDGDTDRFALSKGNTDLISDKTVFSSEIQEGDVLRFCEKGTTESSAGEKSESKVLKNADAIELAETWLQRNIGLDSEDMRLMESSKVEEESFKLLFQNTELDEHYTVFIEGRSVVNYIPAIADDMDLEEN